VKRYHFDNGGKCLGYLDEEGGYFGLDGHVRGFVVRGALYEKDLFCLGHIDDAWNLVDRRGRCCGYFDGRGPLR
jgi:hypothetical protein